jgi:hypothetical protein
VTRKPAAKAEADGHRHQVFGFISPRFSGNTEAHKVDLDDDGSVIAEFPKLNGTHPNFRKIQRWLRLL